MWTVQIFKQSKSRNYEVVLCFQKHSVHYAKRSFAQSTCCKIDFLGHNFSLLQAVNYSESILELKTKIKDLRNIDCLCIDN